MANCLNTIYSIQYVTLFSHALFCVLEICLIFPFIFYCSHATFLVPLLLLYFVQSITLIFYLFKMKNWQKQSANNFLLVSLSICGVHINYILTLSVEKTNLKNTITKNSILHILHSKFETQEGSIETYKDLW